MNQKAVIETLLGRRVREYEAVSIRAIEPPALSDESRHELVEQLYKYFAEVDARRKSGSPEEAEDIITEAMRSVRPAIAGVDHDPGRCARHTEAKAHVRQRSHHE